MVRNVQHFFVLFVKYAFAYKINILWLLILPMGIMVWENRSWLVDEPTSEEYVRYLAAIWGYMITILGTNGVGLTILSLRENGFLKMFKYIAGSITPVVWGQLLSQVLFLLINVVVLTGTTSLLFKPELTLKVLIVSVLVVLIAAIPISLFFIWITTLPYRNESITPIVSISVVILTYVTASYSPSSSVFWVDFLLVFNPVKFIISLSDTLFVFFKILSVPTISFSSYIIVILTYVMLGYVFLKKVKIRSQIIRN